MPIIKDGALILDDWQFVEEDSEIPKNGNFILPLARALLMHGELSNYEGRIGISIPNNEDVEEHGDIFKKVQLVLLHLPSFTDGRAYSQARLLREEMFYKKELRLKGDVLVDQAAYLLRCGFDSFDPDTVPDIDVWNNTVQLMSTSYQTGYRDRLQNRAE